MEEIKILNTDKKKEKFKTIFGPGFEVTIYPEKAQHKGKVSILVHPDNIKTVKDILNTKRCSNQKS